MSIILLIGVGPMPDAGVQRVHAPGLRLKAFMEALSRDGHQIHLGEFTFGGGGEPFRPMQGGGVYAHHPLPADIDAAVRHLDDWVRRIQPDGVVALTDIGALAIARSSYEGPVYIDYNGPPMIERQQQAAAFDHDGGLLDAWLHVLPALLRGDRFAACSASQRLALIGELGAAGRLNKATCGGDLVDVIHPNVPFDTLPSAGIARETLRRHGVPEGSRVVVCSGGYNTWFDEETLFRGLERAMGKDPALHFVSTGGAIPGHVEVVYQRFVDRVGQSAHRSRYHLLGWVPHGELLEVLGAADVAVNCDLWSLEAELGFRNRLLGWAWSGLRIVSTALGSPAVRMARKGLLRSFPPGDDQALADLLLEEAAKGRRTDLHEVHRVLSHSFSSPREFAPLMQWAAHPEPAPDRFTGRVENLLADFQRDALFHHGLARGPQSPHRLAREAGASLLGSRAFRLITLFNRRLRHLAERLRDC